jgi:hypothetical protein
MNMIKRLVLSAVVWGTLVLLCLNEPAAPEGIVFLQMPSADMLGLMAMMLGGSALQGLMNPGISPQTFVGRKHGDLSLEPGDLLGQAIRAVSRMGTAMGDRQRKGVSLRSSFAQSPGTYTGGGLPMPFGLTGRDPALGDPNLLTLPGVETNDPFQNLLGFPGPPPSQLPPPSAAQPPPPEPGGMSPLDTTTLRGASPGVVPKTLLSTTTPLDPRRAVTGSNQNDVSRALASFRMLGINV